MERDEQQLFYSSSSVLDCACVCTCVHNIKYINYAGFARSSCCEHRTKVMFISKHFFVVKITAQDRNSQRSVCLL